MKDKFFVSPRGLHKHLAQRKSKGASSAKDGADVG